MKFHFAQPSSSLKTYLHVQAFSRKMRNRVRMCTKFDLPDNVLGFVLQANLRDALGIDIAGQLRKHFLAAMQSPSQAAAAAAASMAAASNLAWLSNAAGTSGTASAAQMQAAAAALAASTASPPGVGSAPSTSQAVTTEAATLSSGRPVAEAPGSAAAAAAQAAAQAAAAQSAAGVEDPAGCSRQENGRISPRIDPRTGKQIVQCEICHKILADPSSLYRHRKIHSGDKPHQCPFCDRRFIQRYVRIFTCKHMSPILRVSCTTTHVFTL